MILLRQVVAAFVSYDPINTNKRSQRLTSPSTKLPSLADLIKIFVAGTFSADNMLSELPKNMKTVGGSVEWESRHRYPRTGPWAETGKQCNGGGFFYWEYKLWQPSTTSQVHPLATAVWLQNLPTELSTRYLKFCKLGLLCKSQTENQLNHHYYFPSASRYKDARSVMVSEIVDDCKYL